MTVDATAGRVAALRERRTVLDAEGAALAERTMRRASISAMVANAIGVIDVFLLLWFILPSPPGEIDHAANIIAAAVYVPLSFRSEEHTSELQSPCNIVCRLLLAALITD